MTTLRVLWPLSQTGYPLQFTARSYPACHTAPVCMMRPDPGLLSYKTLKYSSTVQRRENKPRSKAATCNQKGNIRTMIKTQLQSMRQKKGQAGSRETCLSSELQKYCRGRGKISPQSLMNSAATSPFLIIGSCCTTNFRDSPRASLYQPSGRADRTRITEILCCRGAKAAGDPTAQDQHQRSKRYLLPRLS